MLKLKQSKTDFMEQLYQADHALLPEAGPARQRTARPDDCFPIPHSFPYCPADN